MKKKSNEEEKYILRAECCRYKSSYFNFGEKQVHIFINNGYLLAFILYCVRAFFFWNYDIRPLQVHYFVPLIKHNSPSHGVLSCSLYSYLRERL
jgi:hypothetical protein